MDQLVQCVYLLKQVILGGKEVLFFWITAQELLLSSSLSIVSWLFCQKAL